MAPSLPSCLSSTFCSHRQASWFILATLSPFFLPFLILCVPFLLLFLAPVAIFLFPLLLLYKVQVSMRPKFKLSHRRADKHEGYQPAQQIAAAESLDVHQQAPLEEDKGLEGSNVQSVETHTHLEEEGDGVGACILPSRVCDFEEDKLGHLEEDLAAQDGITEGKIEEKQEEQDVIEGPLVEESSEGRSPAEYEGPEVSNVQNVESSKARVEDAITSRPSEENRTSSPMTYEGESSNTPYSCDHRSSVPVEWQGQVSIEDRDERLESSHTHPLEEAWSDMPAVQASEPNFQAKTSVFPDQMVEKPWKEKFNGQFDIDTPFAEIVTHEHIREEPGLSSEKDPSLEILGDKGRPDKKEDIFFPAEPFEKKTEEGEWSHSSPEGHGQWRMDAFSKETRDDEKGRPAKNEAVSFEAESSAEREEGYPSEAPSSAVPPPHLSHGGIEFQDTIQEEQKLMADINAIKKIVGYQGGPHASILEQISALYMFLGMEPYNWGAEVDNLERAQAEIELLKVVVGVK